MWAGGCWGPGPCPFSAEVCPGRYARLDSTQTRLVLILGGLAVRPPVSAALGSWREETSEPGPEDSRPRRPEAGPAHRQLPGSPATQRCQEGLL